MGVNRSMSDERKKTGSEILIDQFEKNNLPPVGLESLEKWLDDTPSNRDFYDAMYEQAEVNVKISQAIVDAFGTDRDKQGASIQSLLEKLRSQTNSMGEVAKRGVMARIDMIGQENE